MNTLKDFITGEQGTTAIEYTMIVAVLSIVAIAAFRLIGDTLGTLMDETAANVAGN